MSSAVGRLEKSITWTLVALWVVLMILGLLVAAQIQGLDLIARTGKTFAVREYVHFGKTLLDNGNVGAAMANYQRALELDPENRNAMMGIGLTYLAMNREREAIDWLTKSIKDRQPVNHNALQALGDIYSVRGEPDTAQTYYKRVIEVAPEPSAALLRLGSIYVQLENYKAAIGLFTEAWESWLSLHRYYREVLVIAKEAFSHDSEKSAVLDGLLSQETPPEILALYDANIFRDSRFYTDRAAEIQHRLAGAYYHLGELENAKSSLEIAYSIAPDNPALKEDLAMINQDLANKSNRQ